MCLLCLRNLSASNDPREILRLWADFCPGCPLLRAGGTPTTAPCSSRLTPLLVQDITAGFITPLCAHDYCAFPDLFRVALLLVPNGRSTKGADVRADLTLAAMRRWDL
ncbi:hypothetical protein CPAR01_14031 [Colletotrichum paranaense]|uniref:Uncharacterized protein n=1 Tax=Colletotrichum paranaense TaxID=1914294 RepID=A0ABQ9S2Z3_9PEZI|nr:uncharacterized protein CPAR01_14031 [Colletotrichum paranaense]KAK1523178.1 hypothetical protein CPAR01_14031 [Colletotrichum paranaense]